MVAEPRTLHEFQPPVGLGALAKALAKAQSEFPTIERTREVTVQTLKGGTYKFKYAPLDSIIAAVRPALSSNGLAISQLLEGPDLRTVLLHESGATLEAAVPLPHNTGDTVQQLGSAITYLRRYALQAILGIASEEDDDGNAASGNKATATNRRQPGSFSTATSVVERTEIASTDGLIGTANVGKKGSDATWELKQSPTGHVLVFRLEEGRKGWKVIAQTPIAEAMAEHREAIEAQRVKCWGWFSDESFEKKQPDGTAQTITFQVLHLTRIETPAGTFSEPDEDDGPAAGAPIDTFPEWTGAVPIGDNDLTTPKPAPVGSGAEAACGAVDGSVMDLGTCQLIEGHKSAHKSADGSWPR